ncbi:PRELI domain containing protein 3B-like [Antedon mediterranea]|uniref:PRELI domain containing protein 3B-like n=1 Tax=Antedon mediterranea TaxID=105859 RepID=UPI003AF6FF0A
MKLKLLTMKIWSSEHVFYHPWETVSQAAWRKYPNPMNPSVIGVDVVERSVLPTGKIVSDRILTTEWGLPGWVVSLVGMNPTCHVKEKSEVDIENKTLTLNSVNLTLKNLITIDEKLVYMPHPTIKDATMLKQEAAVQINGLSLSSYLEGIVTTTMASNANKGREAMEWVIDTINTEVKELASTAKKGITELRTKIDTLDLNPSIR